MVRTQRALHKEVRAATRTVLLSAPQRSRLDAFRDVLIEQEKKGAQEDKWRQWLLPKTVAVQPRLDDVFNEAREWRWV